jgi:hypothetical protein
MSKDSNVKLTIAFDDPELDAEDKENEAQKLLAQLKNLDEVESVNRVLDPSPPDGNKALGGILIGLLSAEVSPANLKTLFGFLSDRLGQKPIALEVEANGKKLKVTAHSREELEAAIKAAQDFVGVVG